MTDLQNMIVMLSKSNEEFAKQKSGSSDWKIVLPAREISIVFDGDGNFKYMHKNL